MKNTHLMLYGLALASGLLLADERVRVALVVEFPSSVPETTRVAMEQELRQSVAVEWMGIEWREARQYDSATAYDRVVMVKVMGRCRAEDADTSRRGTSLGFTHVSDGHVLPFIEIDCDRVARAIQKRVFPVGTLAPAPALGRALGRVAGHELYHALAETEVHGSHGLAQPHFGEFELLLSPMSLDQADQLRIQAQVLPSRRTD